MQCAVRRMGNMARSILLFFMLVSHASAEPYQCRVLRQIVPACACEARVWKDIVIADQAVINCRNLMLNHVPNIMGSSEDDVYEMTLVQNDIQTIPAAAFRGLKIQKIDLRKNRLTSFDNNSFQGLENDLKELYLGAEKGASVQPPIDSLTALNSLIILDLEYFKFPGDLLDPGLLNRLTQLNTLILRHNGLTAIEPLSLPFTLTCLTLDFQNLATFPVDAIRHLPQLVSLTITNTDMSTINRGAFEKNTKLVNLDLSYNSINTVSDGCFEGITASLQTLSLRNNPIPSVDTLKEIKYLTSLTTLDLSETTLSTLPVEASFLLDKELLTVLYLDGNDLATLEPNVFSNLDNLQALHLAYNQLAGLDDQSFAGLSSLQYLDLSHQNTTQRLDMPESLSSLTSLETLKLSQTIVNPAMLWPRITPMGSLKILLLDGVTLGSVPDYAFRNLTQIKELSLDGNSLTDVTQEMLAGLHSLQKLTLSRNGITSVSQCAFYGLELSSPLYLELDTNPLNCDCKLKWLLEKRDAGDIDLSQKERCTTPADKNGSYLVNLQPSDLTCVTAPPKESCLELYTTTLPPVTTPMPSPVHNLTVTNVTTTSIIISWTAVPNLTVPYLNVLLQNLETSYRYVTQIAADDTSHRATGLKSNQPYSLCVLATDHQPACVTTQTLPSPSTDGLEDDGSSKEVGIIVGTVAGILLLALIVAAILYLLVCRKRRSKEVNPPPHMFAPGELPAMTPESKQFTKPREKPAPKVGRALDEIKVTVISDGQTGVDSPRHSVGSYQFLDEKHPNPNPNMVPKYHSVYSNDVDGRALPSAPNSSLPGYYTNMGGSSNHYNEIEHQ